MEHPIGNLMATTMQKIKEMVDVNTIVGDPIRTVEGVTIIPVSKVSFGFAAGGSDFTGKNQQPNQENAFGGGSGAGINITPVAFLIINGDSVKLLPVTPPASGVPVPGNTEGSRQSRSMVKYTGTFFSFNAATVSFRPSKQNG